MKAPVGLKDLGDGKWRFRVSGGKYPLTGKQLQPTRTFSGTRLEAEAALAAFKVEVADQAPSEVTRSMTLNELIELHLGLVEVESRTLVGYWSKYNCHIASSVVGTTAVRKLTGVNLTTFYRALVADKGLSVATVRLVGAVIGGACNLAMTMPELGMQRNPARDASLPKMRNVVPKVVRAPTPAVIDDILDGATDIAPKMLNAIILAARTGIRRGELLALRKSDIELEGEVTFVNVRHSIVEIGETALSRGITPRAHYLGVGEHLWMKDTKGHAMRRFAIDADTAQILADHMVDIEMEARFAGVTLAEDFFLFSLVPDHAVPWRPDMLGTAWNRLRAKLAHTEVRWHDFRHFNGTQMGAAHVSIATIMLRLGHNQQTTSFRYISGTSPEDMAAAMALGAASKRRTATQRRDS